MTDTKTILTIETIPQPIRDWLASNVATYIVIELNNRLGFKDIKRQIIPSLIFWLITREIAPENFIAQLGQELQINASSAKNIAAEIVETLLRPIEKSLRTEAGVDIAKILTTEMPPIEKIEKEEEIGEKPPVMSETEPSVVSEVEPFVIHEETPTFRVPIKIMPAPTKPRPAPPPIPVKTPSPTEIKPPEIPKKAPAPIKQETKMLPKTTHQNSHRVVHYSNFISPP